jgi:hypothetical protein
MTEDKWLAAANPLSLLMHVKRTSPGLRAKAGRRKFRLFACGCVRRLWLALPEAVRWAVEVAERVADGESDAEQLRVARRHADRSVDWRSCPRYLVGTMHYVTDQKPGKAAKVWRLTSHAETDVMRGNKPAEEKKVLTALVRDIFGSPFRPVICDPSWQTSTAVGLAEAIYAERAFDRLPILADALEDAGCTHPDVLAHCRGDGPHARGCWVVDLILGKS